MDMDSQNNYIRLCGTVAGKGEYSHSSRAQKFYTFPLEVLRLSGNTDRLNVILRYEQLPLLGQEGSKICISGDVRTFNNRRNDGAKLVITVFARDILPYEGEDENLVHLFGTVCKEPNLRITPMGRDICDIMLAVNRSYGRSDYLPCIFWGINARHASQYTVGTQLLLDGRLQSRKYIKITEFGAVEKTAYEISVTDVLM